MVLPLGIGSGCDLETIEMMGHHNDAILLSFWSCHALKMARCGWMAWRVNRGVTYQNEVKDMTHVWEYLHGVANVAPNHYNEWYIKCADYREI